MDSKRLAYLASIVSGNKVLTKISTIPENHANTPPTNFRKTEAMLALEALDAKTKVHKGDTSELQKELNEGIRWATMAGLNTSGMKPPKGNYEVIVEEL